MIVFNGIILYGISFVQSAFLLICLTVHSDFIRFCVDGALKRKRFLICNLDRDSFEGYVMIFASGSFVQSCLYV